jgi:Zn-dependent peptidase ImmA (M78 family)
MKGGIMNHSHKTEQLPDDVLTRLRRILPGRPLRHYEHLMLAEQQANELHKLLGQTGPAADLSWMLSLKKITVVLQPRWKMDGLSGMTTWADGVWVIGVNKGNAQARRRFTLCHELKHVLDADRDKTTYRSLTAPQREAVADYFAACYLMPKLWVRRAWTSGIQDPEALAGLFHVSQLAMEKRLRYLGFLDEDPTRTVASYFRRASKTDVAA